MMNTHCNSLRDPLSTRSKQELATLAESLSDAWRPLERATIEVNLGTPNYGW